ncbi:MAG: PilZ domain-containing protein [Gammaproteobacteria bacterium]|nr:PilZ domain-containing protein [Gammaproteobacteria bacterium]MCP5418225.1 PilZ domain-containing protein [Chromatiaceae bacterium]
MSDLDQAIERRRFQRVLFDVPARISDQGVEFITSVVDLSLKGALLIRPDDWTVAVGTSVRLTVLLDDSEIRMYMQACVAHTEEDSVGLRFDSIDMESIAHLRRLVELNLGDAALLDREFEALG